jgi:hypothetical protein
MHQSPKHPESNAEKISTVSDKKPTLEELKRTGQQFTTNELIAAVIEGHKGGGGWEEFHTDEFMAELEYEVEIGLIEQLGPKLFRFVPENAYLRERR